MFENSNLKLKKKFQSFDCTISLADIVRYLDGAHRPIREGENLLKSGHVLRVGVKCYAGTGAVILGFVVQTSNIRGAPHEVTIDFKDRKKWSCKCSCKAGLGHKCKHAIAVLLYIQR